MSVQAEEPRANTEESPVFIEGEEIPKCPGCTCLVIWKDTTGQCLHCSAPLKSDA
ncbi:hypothetical protein [Streptomyces sp. KLOTTS4A1]|uniref:hypothetical protein n=1 Tax=Streptomyces sp. KLOTTS4A1 TaxID=3390996 RepID=UPI0039F5146C